MAAQGDEVVSAANLAAALGADASDADTSGKPVSAANLRAVIGAGVMVATTLWEGSSWPGTITCPGSIHDYGLIIFTVEDVSQYSPTQPFVADEYTSNPISIRYTNIYGMESSTSCTISDGSGTFTIACGTGDQPPIREIVAYRNVQPTQ